MGAVRRTTFALYPMTSTVLWALCGTGMQESVLRSTDAGGKFERVETDLPDRRRPVYARYHEKFLPVPQAC